MKLLDLAMLGLILLVSCDPTKPDDHGQKGLLKVKVIDAAQAPMPGAALSFYYVLDSTLKPLTYPSGPDFYSYPNPFTSQCTINFKVYEPSNVTLTVIDEDDSNHRMQPYTGAFNVGTFALMFSMDSTFHDGFYKIKLEKNNSVAFIEVFYAGFGNLLDSYLGTEPCAGGLTDGDGIAYTYIQEFPFIGKIYQKVFENGQYLGNWEFMDSVRVVARTYNIIVGDSVVHIDRDRETDIVFQVNSFP